MSTNTRTEEPLYYIQDTRSLTGNCVSWWQKNLHGYVCNIDHATKVTLERAEFICRTPHFIMRLCSEIDAIAQRHVDIQQLRRI